MPLIQLELENFKSYKGRQIIGPFHEFTAVIGPNGSGKSNLMDALSFVLGVRSAQLRSSQLKDLIYRGVQATEEEEGDEDGSGSKGQGERDASTASVTAVYQDADENEFLFKRSITLAGTSEYRINNRVMTAAAYNDRLKTFNILVKSKNFLVFQGDVEAVASQSPKDLSRLVDQISGSLELKEAYEAAKANMDRALENQKSTIFKRKGMSNEMNFLKGQKNEAERFKRLQKERDELATLHVLWSLFHIDKKIREETKEIDTLTAKMPSLKKELSDLDRIVKKQRSEHAQKQGEIMEQKKLIRSKERQLERQQPEYDQIEVSLDAKQRKLEEVKKTRIATEPELTKYKASIAKLESDYEKTKKAADLAAQEQAAASAAQDISLNHDNLARYHQLKGEANVRAVAERQKLEVISRDIKTKRGSLKSLQDKLTLSEENKAKLEADVVNLKERKERLEEKRNEAQSTLTRLRATKEEAERKKEAIAAKETSLNKTLEGYYNKLKEANVARVEHDKEQRMKEQVIALRKKVSGVHGRLAELCRPTQSKYHLAISTILGKNADAIVVETQRDAIECIEYLKSTRKGQATFIPLDTALVKDIDHRLRSISSGARLAFDVIEYDEKLKRAIQYACGNAVVCDDLSVARMICYEKKLEVKAVTLDSTVIHKSGLISGGQNASGPRQRWEDREVEGLKRQVSHVLAELSELGAQRYEAGRQGDIVAQLNQVETTLTSLNDELSNIQTQLTGKLDEIKVLDKNIKQLKPQVANAQQDLDTSVEQTSSLKQIVDAEDDAVFASFCQNIGVSNIREYEERQLKTLERQNNARAEYEQHMKRLEHQISFDRASLESQEHRLELINKAIAKSTEEAKSQEKEKKKLRSTLDAIIQQIEEERTTLEKMQKDESKSNEAFRKVRQQYDQAQAKLDDCAKETASLHLDIELLATNRLKLYRRCRMEEIALPLESGSKKLSSVPLEEQISLTGTTLESQEDDNDSMDLDSQEGGGRGEGEETRSRSISVPDFGIKVDFSNLSKTEKQDGSEEMGRELELKIETATLELDKMAPNTRANDRLVDTENRLAEVDGEFEKARREAKKAQDEYLRLKKIRCDLFHKAFDHISGKIDQIYKDLTKSKINPSGGNAFIILENTEEPYLAGLQFSALPPAKSFRGIDHLSGGEKTMAAVALLFAIQSVFPAPFIVLDEVDAALDSINVQRVADYIRSKASKNLQFVVISHKASLYERSCALVGVMRNQEINSSATLTLDLEQYA